MLEVIELAAHSYLGFSVIFKSVVERGCCRHRSKRRMKNRDDMLGWSIIIPFSWNKLRISY